MPVLLSCSTFLPPTSTNTQRRLAITPCHCWVPLAATLQGHGVPSPPAWLLRALAQRLRHQTGLNLFNFDVIVPMHLHRRSSPQAAHDSHQGGSAAEDSPAAAAAAASGASSEQQELSRLRRPGEAGGGTGAAAEGQDPAADDPLVLDLQAAAQAAAAAAAATAAVEREVAARRQAEQQQGTRGGEEAGEQGELLYHLIDINYFPGEVLAARRTNGCSCCGWLDGWAMQSGLRACVVFAPSWRLLVWLLLATFEPLRQLRGLTQAGFFSRRLQFESSQACAIHFPPPSLGISSHLSCPALAVLQATRRCPTMRHTCCSSCAA